MVTVKIVVYNGDEFPVRAGVEVLNSLSITKSIGIDKYPWLIGSVEMRYLSNYEGIFLSMLSRCDVYKMYPVSAMWTN